MKRKEKRQNGSVRLPDDLFARVRRLADAEGRTIGGQLARLVAEALPGAEAEAGIKVPVTRKPTAETAR
ncbi:MAG: hypothetical protein IT337_11060 [Thermomicrobiales bacterium]|nr:hypothetical protein [Thermomicrobiales bacterium]